MVPYGFNSELNMEYETMASALKKTNVVSIHAASKEAALERLGQFGIDFRDASNKVDNSRYEAAAYYGSQVAAKIFDLKDDAKLAVTAYCEKAGLAVTGPSFGVMVSTFRSFGNPAVQGRKAEIEKAIVALPRDKRANKDLYAAAYAVNAKINAMTEAKQKVPELKTLLPKLFAEAQAKKDATIAKRAPIAKAKDPIEAAKHAMQESIEALVLGKLTPKQKAALEAVKLAFKL